MAVQVADFLGPTGATRANNEPSDRLRPAGGSCSDPPPRLCLPAPKIFFAAFAMAVVVGDAGDFAGLSRDSLRRGR